MKTTFRKSLLTQIRKSEAIVANLAELIEKMEVYECERSDKCHDSEARETFEDEMYEVESFKDAIETAAYDIRSNLYLEDE